MSNLFVGIPTYNAASSVVEVIQELEQDSRVQKIIVVDDASGDATSRSLAKSGFEKVHYLRNATNRGYGGSVKVIFDEFRKLSPNPSDLLLIVHADGQTPLEEIPRFLEAYEKGNVDVVLGSRMLSGFQAQFGNRPLSKIIGDYILTGLQNRFYGLSLSSYATGYRAFRRGALDELEYEFCDDRHNFDTESILEAKRARLRMVEIPIRTVKSRQISNNELLQYAFRSVKTFFKYGLYKSDFNRNTR